MFSGMSEVITGAEVHDVVIRKVMVVVVVGVVVLVMWW